MKRWLTSKDDAFWYTTLPLVVLGLFTLFASVGYATFGRHPEWLSYVPQFAGFFGTAFTFFARGQVWISVLVLGIYLTYRTKNAWLGGFVLVYVISLSSELAGTRFGLPFGEYSYTDLLGLKWFGLVPILIPISWFTMAIPSYVLATAIIPAHKTVSRIVLAAGLLTLWDLSLDPAMSFLTTYWLWGDPGPYYGMPLINLAGWFATGLVIMTGLYLINVDRWTERLSVRWMGLYYALIVMMPFAMILAAGLWGAVLATLITLAPIAWYVYRRLPPENYENPDQNPEPFAVLDANNGANTNALRNFFKIHSRSFSFAARFFSTEQYRLVTQLYAFCRTTDDFADRYAAQYGIEQAEAQLDTWENSVKLSYEGLPSGLSWLDELMATSSRSGVPYEVIGDLIKGVRSDLRKVELQTVEALDNYAYQVASVVGIWLCYLFGVREREVLDRAAALGRAMQITNILRDVGEDLRMHRLYIPAELMDRFNVSKDELLAMEAGTLAPTESYKALLEHLIERAEADYHYAFRGLTAVPPSFARAAAVASEIYKGIHGAIRRKKYNNFKYRAYTRWYEKVFLTLRALRRLRLMQKRPFLPETHSVYITNQPKPPNPRSPRIGYLLVLLVITVGSVFGIPDASYAQPHVHDTVTMSIPEKSETSQTLLTLRAFYLAGVEDKDAIEDGLTFADSLPALDPIHEGYRAALTILKAKHAFWPIKKMRYLKEGLPILDTLLTAQPDHVELRYLRLLSCYYLPRFLGRSDSVREDLAALASLLPKARSAFPPKLYDDMWRFVEQNKKLIDKSSHERRSRNTERPQNAIKHFER